jgi:hypothetical protein
MYAEAIGVCVMYIYLHKAWVSHHCSRERERERDDYKSPVQYSCCREGGKHMLMQGMSYKAHVVVCFSILGLWETPSCMPKSPINAISL